MATDRTERLLNLVICLLGTRRPVPRATLREGIPGYGDAASDEAFERMFERDKDELRQMGIPIDTVVNAQGEVEGYLIDEDAYAMPELALDAAELGVLGLAARLWGEAAIAAQASAAMRKIEATTGERWDPPSLISGRPPAGDESLPALWEAIRSRRPVGFGYLPRGRDTAAERAVEPWTTVHREGAWYLVGLSRERGEGRAFRLSRIQGGVRLLEGTFVPPAAEAVAGIVAGIAEPAAPMTARVRLPQARGTRLRARGRSRSDGTIEVDYADVDVLVADVLEAGGAIVEPAQAAAALRAALVRVRDMHGDAHA